MNLLSPDAYYRALKHIFSKDKIPFDVKDVFVVPNYKDFLKPQIDSRFQGWTRGDLTQLQWKFQKVKKDYIFPLGVKIEYRSFCSDEVFEIKSTGILFYILYPNNLDFFKVINLLYIFKAIFLNQSKHLMVS
jgi:hypothetical protein